MIATLVYVDVKPECVTAFEKITVYNHDHTRNEPGNIRFDVLRRNTDGTQFILYEVFKDEAAASAHKETEHYLKWRAEVADYMASPRHATATTPVAFD